ncbi:hypothetical protein PIB30_015181 [Stylosanthes scabra]|uniref:Uncharacterized protein n=1 Tax=Stylosanthes scabra TaxID=79078 RepID=A0ABU6UA05_9FABA|nr:hypothetical protein [Stylosanthes scabra]
MTGNDNTVTTQRRRHRRGDVRVGVSVPGPLRSKRSSLYPWLDQPRFEDLIVITLYLAVGAIIRATT